MSRGGNLSPVQVRTSGPELMVVRETLEGDRPAGAYGWSWRSPRQVAAAGTEAVMALLRQPANDLGRCAVAMDDFGKPATASLNYPASLSLVTRSKIDPLLY